jgi:hypothetical protein
MDLNEVMKNFSGDGTMAYGVDTAIKALRPGSRYEVSVSGGEYTYTKWWDPNQLPPPTKKEVDKELAFQEKLAKYYQYAYSRCSEYPDGFEQLDMLWHAVDNGINLKDSEWFKSIKEVKDKYPKPEEEPPVKD